MNKKFVISLFICLILASSNVYGQGMDTTNTTIIHILNNKLLTFTKTDSGEYYRFVGDVVMQQGTDTLYCDSLYQNKTTNILEAFSNVRIAQIDGTQGLSDYLRYTAAQKQAYMSGHVSLTDGKNKLWCEALSYNLGAKVAVYNNNGTLQADSTLVTSQTGVYNVKTKEARFGGHVIVTDPQYYTTSDDMEYNTDTKVTRFFAPSVVTGDSGRSILQTSNGIYDSHNGIADLYAHSSVWYDGYYLEGDTIHYSKLSGYGYAYGNVIGIDTGHHATLFCGRTIYNRKKRIMWAWEIPVLQTINGKDTIYMRADTFYSAPMPKVAMKKGNKEVSIDSIRKNISIYDSISKQSPEKTTDTGKLQPVTQMQKDTAKATTPPGPPIPETGTEPSLVQQYTDTLWQNMFRVITAPADTARAIEPVRKKTNGKGNGKALIITKNKIVTDTAQADTTAPLFFTGYHHVRIFSDSMQGVCDSIIYTQSDSTIRMIYNPILWSHNSQVTGDTILMLLDSNKLKYVYVPNNAFTVSLAGPPKAELYDQVQGKTLKAFFKNNTITHLVVMPNAEAIYYPKDDSGAFIGASEANSQRMRIYFEDQKIKTIKFESDVHQTLTPLEKADLPTLRLSRFKWLIDRRPKTKEELFR